MTTKKQDLNKVDHEKLVEVARIAGLELKVQSAYTKCTFPGSPGKIYIANTKKVTRVDLTGFNAEHEGVIQISRDLAAELKLGNVCAQLDFSLDEETILAALAVAAEALKETKAPEKPKKTSAKKVKKAPKPPKAKEAKGEATEEPREPTEEERKKIERLQVIRDAAKRQAEKAASQNESEA